MKRLINEVSLVFFQDDATGEWGVTHKETCDRDYGFNAFWSGIGIFHDVFEHWHEHKHKYFQGEAAMNLGGEMAAMGAMWYFVDELGIASARRLNPVSIYSDQENMRLTTESEIREAIYQGYYRFGDTLISRVPKQSPTDNGELEYQIEFLCDNVKGFRFGENNYSTDSEREFAANYKASVTFRKVADLHRWGYKHAKKMIPDNWQNRNTLIEFISFWKEFTKNNSAEELQTYFKELVFKIYKDGDKVSWKAVLISNSYDVADLKITHTSNVMEDVYSSMPE